MRLSSIITNYRLSDTRSISVFDNMCRMGRWLFWSWFDVNRSIFDEDVREIRFLHIRSQRPWPSDLKFAPVVTLVHGHVSAKSEVSIVFLFRENRRHGTHGHGMLGSRYAYMYVVCTDASTTKLLGTWWTTAHQYPTLPIVNGYVLPVVTKSLYHVTGRRAFAVAGPTIWNSVPEDMRDPEASEDSYRQSLKTFLFAQY